LNVRENVLQLDALPSEAEIMARWSGDATEPVVSVLCTTYNHGRFIRSAMAGFLAQKTTFPFEIIVHDDASTDDTASIVAGFAAAYPRLIKAILQTENQFSKGRHIFARFLFPVARGRYFALCEGDDYWDCSDKLQSQVDGLDGNPRASMSFHDVGCEAEDGLDVYVYPKPAGAILEFPDILGEHYIATCALMLRKSAMPAPLPEWYFKCLMGDVPLELMLASEGSALYIPRQMGVYRRHSGGITSSRQQNLAGRGAYIFIYSRLRSHLGWRYWHLITLKLLRYQAGYIKDFLGLNRNRAR
jgi:glycosyltransferase involved in cell wall biosynthesis